MTAEAIRRLIETTREDWDMPGPYLTQDELQDLTGYRTRSAACRWLNRNGWPYAEPAGGGWPRVLREYHDSRLSGEVGSKSKQASGPNWSRA